MQTMRAFQIDKPGGAGDLRRVDLPIPEPGAGQARVRVAYCGLNPLDIIVRSGGAVWMAPPWPIVLGVEHSGVVDAVGEGVDPAWLGRAVIGRATFGGNADFCIAAVTALAAAPDDMDLRQAAVYRGCTHTAWRLLHEGVRTAPCQTALFHSAAGPVGIMLTQFAKRLGMTVIGLVGTPAKQAFAADFGADHLIDLSAEPDWPSAVLQTTSGRGVDLSVDGNGGEASARNFDVIAPCGEVVFIGATSGAPSVPVSPGLLIVKHAAARGFNLNTAERFGRAIDMVDSEIVGLWRSGKIKLPITSVSPFDSIPELHRRFENRDIQGRAVIEVGGDAIERMRVPAD